MHNVRIWGVFTCYTCHVAECVFRVLDSHPEYPFRPCIQNNGEAPKGYCQLMESAWSEREDDRPSFSDILLKLQQTFPQLKYACLLQLDHFQCMQNIIAVKYVYTFSMMCLYVYITFVLYWGYSCMHKSDKRKNCCIFRIKSLSCTVVIVLSTQKMFKCLWWC